MGLGHPLAHGRLSSEERGDEWDEGIPTFGDDSLPGGLIQRQRHGLPFRSDDEGDRLSVVHQNLGDAGAIDPQRMVSEEGKASNTEGEASCTQVPINVNFHLSLPLIHGARVVRDEWEFQNMLIRSNLSFLRFGDCK